MAVRNARWPVEVIGNEALTCSGLFGARSGARSSHRFEEEGNFLLARIGDRRWRYPVGYVATEGSYKKGELLGRF